MKTIPLFFLFLLMTGLCREADEQSANDFALLCPESNEDFANPERGFYHQLRTNINNFVMLDPEVLKRNRTTPNIDGSAQYQTVNSLVWRLYDLEGYNDKPLPQSFLDNLTADFKTARDGGVKLMVRFAYIYRVLNKNCGSSICPPYGDAPKEIVLGHLTQLKPYLYQNADIIACIQLGLIGIWGECHYSDYFGYDDAGWKNRNEVLKALLDAVPEDRMVVVRTPQTKQWYIYGINSPYSVPNITEQEAYSGTDKARIFFYNDCYLASNSDYGTYSYKQRTTGEIIAAQRNYFSNESKYGPVFGETCDDKYSPYNDCVSAGGQAEVEFAMMHYSGLNAAYNNTVNNDWQTGGCMDDIKRKLGYRFVIRERTCTKKVKRGETFNVAVDIDNIGYASPFNPRPVELILRNISDKKIIRLSFNTDCRRWHPGSTKLTQSFTMPENAARGKYELLLNLPDKYESISKRPEYSVRFANDNVWEPGTGYNDLKALLTVY